MIILGMVITAQQVAGFLVTAGSIGYAYLKKRAANIDKAERAELEQKIIDIAADGDVNTTEVVALAKHLSKVSRD